MLVLAGMVHRRKYAQMERGAPLGGYLALHHEPSASVWGPYQPLPLVLGFMAPRGLSHPGVAAHYDVTADREALYSTVPGSLHGDVCRGQRQQ
jgi:hypothetical protein